MSECCHHHREEIVDNKPVDHHICADHEHEHVFVSNKSNISDEERHDAHHLPIHHEEEVVFDIHIHGAGCGDHHPVEALVSASYHHNHGGSCDHGQGDASWSSLPDFLAPSSLFGQHDHEKHEHAHCKQCDAHVEKGETLCEACKHSTKTVVASCSH